MKRETRTGEIRATTDDGTIEILAVAYGVTDDYGTQFRRGTFTDSLEHHLPVIAWAHSWDEPIGRATGFRESDEGLYLTARLDIGGSVPRADQAYEQMRSGTLTDVSVGFMRRSDEEADGVTIITKADLDEVSVVLRGAVPGAKVLAVRSARSGEMVEVDAVVAIAKKKSAGEITEAEADEALRLLSAPPIGTPPVESTDGTATGTDTGEGLPELDAVLAEADAALDLLTDRSRR